MELVRQVAIIRKFTYGRAIKTLSEVIRNGYIRFSNRKCTCCGCVYMVVSLVEDDSNENWQNYEVINWNDFSDRYCPFCGEKDLE